ncbi:hypothetical protein LCGC14_3041820, partial [marine sediment metagenome]
GLKDKNGKEIWEGDIVRHTHGGDPETKTDLVVTFETGAFMAWYVEYPKNKTLAMSIYPYCEIIGNIHENPELLK